MPQFFIDRPIFAWVVALTISLAGLLAIPNLPVSQYPAVAPPSITIQATYPGASAQEVADSVASVIENELNGAKGLLYYESVSNAYGRAEITATFRPDIDPDMAQVDVQNRISNVTSRLPAAVMEQGLRVNQSNASFLMFVAMYTNNEEMDQIAIADYITRNVQNEMLRVPGVGRFQLFASPRAMRIWVDADKLTGLNLGMSEVLAAVSSQNTLVSAGILGAPPNDIGQRVSAPIVVNGELRTAEEFGNIVLRANVDGSMVRLRDVARVEMGADTYQFGGRLNGKATSSFAISLTSDANALETAAGIKARLKELSQFFPPGLEYAIPYDTTPYVNTSINQVLMTLAEAMLLVFLVMYLFLQNVRYTLIPALVVPVALLGSMTVILALGFSINVLTMFAMVLAIGILVDDAIVVVENVERIMVEDGSSPKEATRIAMPQISGAVVGMTLVLATVFFPLAFMSGSVGIIYRQFAITMAVSILFSGFLALTFTPALCATILKPVNKGHHETKRGFFGWFNRSFDAVTNRYQGWVGKTLKRGGRIMFVYLLLIVALGVLYFRLPTSFLPQEDQGYAIVNIELPAGATANRTMEVIEQVEGYFMGLPQTKDIVTVRGFSFNGMGLNAALAFVMFDDFDKRKAPQHSAQALAGAATGRLLFGIPDAMTFAIVPPSIQQLGNASGFDVRLQDRAGLGQAALSAATQQFLGMAMANPKLVDVRVTGLGPGPQLQIKVNREKAATLGVNFNEVAALISTAVGSTYISKYPNMGRIQNVWVQAVQDQRMTPEDILKLTARNRSGDAVPLSSFVDVSWTHAPVQVVRYNSYESIRIGGAAAPGWSSGDAMDEVEAMMAQLPEGFGFEWTGLSYQEKQAGAQSLILMGLAMLVVFMVLAALYESWAIPLSVILMVPLGMLGAVGMVTALGMENNIYFQVGMVTVIGLAAKNAILIVEFAKDLYADTGDLLASTVEAARLRFRPILMTSFAFIFGVVPLTLATGAGAASQNSVGFGVLGGMLAATPLAMLFVPTFFVVVMKLFRVKAVSHVHIHTAHVGHDEVLDAPAPAPAPAAESNKQGDQA